MIIKKSVITGMNEIEKQVKSLVFALKGDI